MCSIAARGLPLGAMVLPIRARYHRPRQPLEAVVSARAAAQAGLAAAKANPGNPGAMGQLAAAQGALNAGLGRLLAVVEAYPDLKANQNMMQL